MRHLVDSESQVVTPMQDSPRNRYSSSNYKSSASRLADRTERLKAINRHFQDDNVACGLYRPRKDKSLTSKKSFNTSLDLQIADRESRGNFSTVTHDKKGITLMTRHTNNMKESSISAASGNSGSGA